MSFNGCVIVGASSGVGRALAGEMAGRGVDLVCAASGERDLAALCADLSLRYGVKAYPLVCDLAAPNFSGARFYESCNEYLSGADTLFYVAGAIHAEDDGFPDDPAAALLTRVNFTSPLKIISRFAQAFEKQGKGHIVALSSIAAATPRGRNMMYAASKSGLETYLASLRHYFAQGPVNVQTVALGYVDTAMSYGQKLLLPRVSPAQTARFLADNLEKGSGKTYYPRYWGAITGVLGLLPWPLYKRLKF